MEQIEIFGLKINSENENKIPLFLMSVSAGIPVEASTQIEQDIDLNEFLVEHPMATFFAKVRGVNMQNHGISDEDILIFDTSIEPSEGKLVIASVNGNFTLKLFHEVEGEFFLESDDNQILPMMDTEDCKISIIGVVTKVIHSL